MRKYLPTFLATTASFLAVGCLLVAGAGNGAATSTDDPPPPPVTTTNPPDPDGNPWHD